MNNQERLDIYSDYLLSSLGPTTATGLSRLVGGSLSHDEITRLLAGEMQSSASWWHRVKPLVRQHERADGVLIFDDSIEEKPYTDENDIICWHYDHSKDRNLKGINFLTALYYNGEVSLPVAFQLIAKTETYVDAKSGKTKRRSPKTKNEYYREMVAACVRNHLRFRYVLNDSWYASVDNMKVVKGTLERDFIMALKSNRKVALSEADKAAGKFQAVSTLATPEGTVCKVWLEGLAFPLLSAKQVFTNEDGSTGTLYLVSSDLTLNYLTLTTIYQKRWKIEEYHRSLKQNAALARSPTRTVTTQTNHFVAALYAYVKLEMLKVTTKLNHYALKTKLYLSALQQAYRELQKLQPISLPAVNPAA
jgi:DDE superfamily endonuclease